MADAASLNVLLRKFGADRAALDMEENRTRTGYGYTVEDLAEQQKNRRLGLSQQMADRGRSFAGAAFKGNTDLQTLANKENQRAAQTANDAFANIARKRLEAQYAYDAARLGLG